MLLLPGLDREVCVPVITGVWNSVSLSWSIHFNKTGLNSPVLIIIIILYKQNITIHYRHLQFVTTKSKYRLLKFIFHYNIYLFWQGGKKRNKEKNCPQNDYNNKHKKVACLLVVPPASAIPLLASYFNSCLD